MITVSRSIWYNRGELVRILSVKAGGEHLAYGVTYFEAGRGDPVHLKLIDGSEVTIDPDDSERVVVPAGVHWPTKVEEALREKLIQYLKKSTTANLSNTEIIRCDTPAPPKTSLLVIADTGADLQFSQVTLDFFLRERLTVTTIPAAGIEKILPLMLRHCSSLTALALAEGEDSKVDCNGE